MPAANAQAAASPIATADERHAPANRGSGVRVGLFGLFGAGNFGNDGSLEAMLQLLRRDTPGAELVAICAEPELVAATHRVSTLPLRVVMSGARWQRTLDRVLAGFVTKLVGWQQALAVTRQLDVLLIPGTGILDDFGTGPSGMPYGLFRWCLAARFNGVRIAFVSIGAGPIHNRISRWLMSSAAAMADYRSYREIPSRDFMQSLGFDVARDPLRPDLAFALAPAAPSTPAGERPPKIGLGIMTYRGWSGDSVAGQGQFDRYLDRMADLLVAIVEKGMHARLLIGETTDDLAVRAVLDRIEPRLTSARRQMIDWQAPRTLEDVISAASSTDVVVASRFHNIVAALIAGKSAISLGYASKNVALLEQFGLGAFCHEIEHFETQAVLEQIVRLVDERQVQGPRIAAAVASLRGQIDVQQAWLTEHVIQPRRDRQAGHARTIRPAVPSA
ncbi:MAG: polysaccharide pyruvyl transferase family protein [Hyphomicrobium sp.]